MPPFRGVHLAAANTATANRFVVSTNMIVGAYSLAATTMPTPGARHVTITHTQVGGVTDTLGTIAVVGTDMDGNVISESITPLSGTVATGLLWFKTVTSITGVGWVINTGNDTIVAGCDNRIAALTSGGLLHAVTVNTTAAGTVTLADTNGTVAILKTSIAEGDYFYDVTCAGFLEVTLGAASDITVSVWPY
jgi:hypothetical protein